MNVLLNSLGADAAVDDDICDHILREMYARSKDASPNVRIQALNALGRLQNPDDPNDIIVKAYLYHLNYDPSVAVRIAVLTVMGRSSATIPGILARLSDADDRVRRHVYMQMSSYPVRSYKVIQRLTLLESGLGERHEMARKVVVSVMMPNWLESYENNYVAFLSSLKMDAKEEDLQRFQKTARLALMEMFK